jgi:hypothetical protein
MKLNLPNVTLVGVEGVESKLDKYLFAAEQCCKNIDFKEVKLLSHLDLNHSSQIKIKELTNVSQYSLFMFEELYKYIDTDFMMIFQSDGFILNHEAWDDTFLEYDYVGAPWFDGVVGNGGFSLRSTKLMDLASKIDFPSAQEFLTTHAGGIFEEAGTLSQNGSFTPREDATPPELVAEDHLICRTYAEYLKERGMKFAPEKLAMKFSLEHNWGHPYIWEGQFGFHNDKITDISNWEEYKRFKEIGDNTTNEHQKPSSFILP